ncbi:MAG: hypothetical protein JWO97_364 [Acidobacteria bacterium]|nr:hypothetical protein [Acidobacteriota bacterium]
MRRDHDVELFGAIGELIEAAAGASELDAAQRQLLIGVIGDLERISEPDRAVAVEEVGRLVGLAEAEVGLRERRLAVLR